MKITLFLLLILGFHSTSFSQKNEISALIMPSEKCMTFYKTPKINGEFDYQKLLENYDLTGNLHSLNVYIHDHYPLLIRDFNTVLKDLKSKQISNDIKSYLIKKYNLIIEIDLHTEKNGSVKTVIKEVVFYSNGKKITSFNKSVTLVGGIGQIDLLDTELIDNEFLDILTEKMEDVFYYFEQLPPNSFKIERVKFEGKKTEQNSLFAYWRYPNSQETFGEKNHKQSQGEIDLSLAFDGQIYNGTYSGQYVKIKMQQFINQTDKNGEKETVSIDKSSFEWPHGKGKFTSKGLIIEGEWLEGKIHGKSLLEQKDSIGNLILKYDGDFLNNERHGKGDFNHTQRYSYNGDWIANKISGFGKITYSNENMYEGQWKDNKREGKGVYINNRDKNIFTKISGNWNANYKEGDGVIYYLNGDSLKGTVNNNINPKFTGTGILHFNEGLYNGDFVNSEYSGQGKFEFTSGDFEEGLFKDGLFKDGTVKIHYTDNSSYEGEMKNEKFDGQGTYTWANSNYYSGLWKDGKQNGQGKFVNTDGTISEGIFADNNLKNGEITKTNGEYFKGVWDINSVFRGKAKKIASNKSIWEGEWEGDIPVSNGIVTFSDGRTYIGEWLGRLTAESIYYNINGIGKMTYPNDEVYEGNFKLDVREGKGTFTYLNGNIYEGNWQNNLPNGFGILKFANGDIYEGNFINEVRTGFGKMTFKNKSVYEGDWENNIQNGKGKLELMSGEVKEGVFKGGVYLVPAKLESVTIGNQVWATKNLNVDKFRNGDPIPHAKTPEEWSKADKNQQPAWCYYANNEKNGVTYGKLYNWYAVNDSRGLAPNGWHIPSRSEFNVLIDNYKEKPRNDGLIVFDFGDNAIKLRNRTGWIGKNGDNESGFSALPGGEIKYYETLYYNWNELPAHWDFTGKGESSGYWSSECCFAFNSSASAFRISENSCSMFDNETKGNGYSVRCVKD
jgi:uncharacterized protein (TIGR02145 family)